jgi:hypothetical protein
MLADAAPRALALQLFPENTVFSCASEAFVTDAIGAPVREVRKTTGAAPTDTVVGAGIAVPEKGSVPEVLKAST